MLSHFFVDCGNLFHFEGPKSKYIYSGYEIEIFGASSLSLGNDFTEKAIFLGADNSL